MQNCFYDEYLLFLGWRSTLKVYSVGTHWMWNLIMHPMSSLDRNLSKNMGRYVENTNKKGSFFNDTYPQIYNKKLFNTYTVFQI